jgi:hypothetical protein
VREAPGYSSSPLSPSFDQILDLSPVFEHNRSGVEVLVRFPTPLTDHSAVFCMSVA